ncbi:hypothetical protein A6R68_05493 [Neotoma lepida]|uniref:Uncharacterized protein n=1 Tax=Neotoma lepida TaxID=56216 RepID=A0A1A6GKV0_NEOLE|nr:hypothetical protein A6R68_05493 [Neotoma lepida]
MPTRLNPRASFLRGLYHSHPSGPTPLHPRLQLFLFSGHSHPYTLPLTLFLGLFRCLSQVVLVLGKKKEEPGPELHIGCLDGLRSLFEGPLCPYPGALIPFQVPGTSHDSPATISGDQSFWLKILQLTRHPENWPLQARWHLVEELYWTFDAYSTFYLNSSGLICLHYYLDKLMPSHSPSTSVKRLLVRALVAPGFSETKPKFLYLFLLP